MNEMTLVKAIVEVVGKPEAHVKKSLDLVLKNVEEQKRIKIIKKEVFPPKKNDVFFSAFAELEIKFESPGVLVDFCFDFMPSSIEIIEPSVINLRTQEFTNSLNDILSRLHGINMSLTNINAENKLLKQNAQGLLKNIIMLSIKDNSLSLDEISNGVGIKTENLKPFVDKYVKQGKIKKIKDKYKLVKSLY